ncbi:MAG: hypothetical protein PHU78_08975 [Heliobacteriaceae bacterium]|nr:hypothetical protein [Heliobacteriaceae bacterium]
MKNLKRLLAVTVAVGVLGAAGAGFAAEVKTPAEIIAGLTGKTVAEVTQEKAAGKTCGTIAQESGKLAEFKQSMLENKQAVLQERVTEDRLTQEKADEIYNALKDRQANCDGTGQGQIGKKYGAGFGQGQGLGNGPGHGQGQGKGLGAKNGHGGNLGFGRGK